MKRVSLVLVCLLVFSGLAVAAEVSLLSLGDAPGQWEVSIGKGALDGAIKAMEQEGEAGVEMFYSHPAQSGFDYIDYNYIPQSPLNVLLKTIRVRSICPLTRINTWSFSFTMLPVGLLLHFPHGPRQGWKPLPAELGLPGGPGLQLHRSDLIRFRSIGDAGTKATTGRYVLTNSAWWTEQREGGA